MPVLPGTNTSMEVYEKHHGEYVADSNKLCWRHQSETALVGRVLGRLYLFPMVMSAFMMQSHLESHL